VKQEMADGREADVVARLRAHLANNRLNRTRQP
jgi:hypothetical protein